MLKFAQTVYPDWTVEEIAKELAECYDAVQNANKNPEGHHLRQNDALFLGFAYKIKDWAESKLCGVGYGTLKANNTFTINNNNNAPAVASSNNPCEDCPNNHGPGTICHCVLGAPKVTC